MTDPTFPSRAAAQKAGWFSRRHRTDEAHREHRALYKATRSRAARRAQAEERNPPPPVVHVPEGNS